MRLFARHPCLDEQAATVAGSDSQTASHGLHPASEAAQPLATAAGVITAVSTRLAAGAVVAHSQDRGLGGGSS